MLRGWLPCSVFQIAITYFGTAVINRLISIRTWTGLVGVWWWTITCWTSSPWPGSATGRIKSGWPPSGRPSSFGGLQCSIFGFFFLTACQSFKSLHCFTWTCLKCFNRKYILNLLVTFVDFRLTGLKDWARLYLSIENKYTAKISLRKG